PGLHFKTKNSWVGHIPIESDVVKNGSLFFWMWGKDDVNAGDDLIIWINGGPGCSSMFGMVHENGPFKLQEKGSETTKPSDYSWTKVSNIVYVDQPAHVGFSQGRTYFTNETQIGKEFASFLDNFYEIFPELKPKRLWITGESYAGIYLSYTLHELQARNQSQLQGTLIVDGVITDQSMLEPPVYPFVVKHQVALNFSAEDVQDVKDEAARCNLTDYVERNLHYPPKGPLPEFDQSCSPYTMMAARASDRNTIFNVYNVEKPDIWDGDYTDYTDKFFNNGELQDYINIPRKRWDECNYVFLHDDQSPPPDSIPDKRHSMLAQVIENSKKFMLISGNLDARVMTNMTALALQNMTWAGSTGFSKAPGTPLYDIDGKEAGAFVEERGLIFAEIFESGHMVPKDNPPAGFAAVKHLLGQKDWSKK
ncbi:alpha/beta-hydrolase, partial [Meira miltonrushii]